MADDGEAEADAAGDRAAAPDQRDRSSRRCRRVGRGQGAAGVVNVDAGQRRLGASGPTRIAPSAGVCRAASSAGSRESAECDRDQPRRSHLGTSIRSRAHRLRAGGVAPPRATFARRDVSPARGSTRASACATPADRRPAAEVRHLVVETSRDAPVSGRRQPVGHRLEPAAESGRAACAAGARRRGQDRGGAAPDVGVRPAIALNACPSATTSRLPPARPPRKAPRPRSRVAALQVPRPAG